MLQASVEIVQIKQQPKSSGELRKSQVKIDKSFKSKVKVKFNPVKTLTAVADLPTAHA